MNNIKWYVPPENVDFEKSKYKSYWAFLWLLNCTDEQFESFVESDSEISLEEFNWAYNFLLINLCKRKIDIFAEK